MTSAIHPISESSGSSDDARKGASLPLRIRTRLSRGPLNWQLAHGATPEDGPELALRAEQLNSASERTRIADALVTTLGDARAREPVTIRRRPQRAAVRDAADEILALALRLRDDRPVATAGIAKAAWLVGDKLSPMHRHGAGDLREALRSALTALDASEGETGAAVPRAA
jgi:hypothetical protein